MTRLVRLLTTMPRRAVAASTAAAKVPSTLPLTYEQRVWTRVAALSAAEPRAAAAAEDVAAPHKHTPGNTTSTVKASKARASRRSSETDAPAVAADTHTREDAPAAASTHMLIGVDEAGRGPLAGPVVAAAVVLTRTFDSAPVLGVDDSKSLVCESDREHAYARLVAHPGLVWSAAVVDVAVIDRINILASTMLAMERAVAGVQAKLRAAGEDEGGGRGTSNGAAAMPEGVGNARLHVLVDGPRVPKRLTEAVSRGGVCIPVCEGEPDGAVTCSDTPGDAVLGRLESAEPLVGGDAKCYSIAAASIIAKVTRDRIMHTMAAKWPEYGFDVHKGYGVPAHVAAIAKHGPCPIHRRTFAPVKNWFPLEPEAAPAAGKRPRKEADKPRVAVRKTKKAAAAPADEASATTPHGIESTAAGTRRSSRLQQVRR